MHHGLLLPALLAGATILLWASALLPEYLVALIFFTATMVLHAAPPAVVFTGFLSDAFWLILGGFVIGSAIRKVGLADRVARHLAARMAHSWPALVGGVVLLTYALAFVMPSNMGRIALLMPVVMAVADRAGLAPGSAGRAGLALAVGFGTFQLSASILPSNLPNMVMAGAAESAFGVHFAYLPYLLLHAPVLGVLKGVVLAGCVVRLFPAVPRPVADTADAAPPSAAEWRLGVLLLVTLGLWMTDQLHGIPPAWVGLVTACICLLPRVGFLSGEEFAAGVNLRTCLYIAGILGVAAYVVQSGLGAALGRLLLAVLPDLHGRPGLGFATVLGVASVLNFAVTANGVPAVFTPLAPELVQASGFSLLSVLMLQVIAYATPLLPYQSSPIVVAMGMARVSARDGLRLSLAVAGLSFLVLAPLDYLWFRVLGWIA